jgi:hypothetical protein
VAEFRKDFDTLMLSLVSSYKTYSMTIWLSAIIICARILHIFMTGKLFLIQGIYQLIIW